MFQITSRPPSARIKLRHRAREPSVSKFSWRPSRDEITLASIPIRPCKKKPRFFFHPPATARASNPIHVFFRSVVGRCALTSHGLSRRNVMYMYQVRRTTRSRHQPPPPTRQFSWSAFFFFFFRDRCPVRRSPTVLFATISSPPLPSSPKRKARMSPPPQSPRCSRPSPSTVPPPPEPLSINGILREHCRSRLFVRPLHWTSDHLRLLDCRFVLQTAQLGGAAGSQQQLDREVVRVATDLSCATERSFKHLVIKYIFELRGAARLE